VGSTWLYRLVADSLRLSSPPLPKSIASTGTLLLEHPDAAGFLANLSGDWIFKAHSFAELDEFPGTRFLSIHRDPRDVTVSTAFYLTWLPPERGGRESGFSAGSIQERIRAVLENEYFLEKLEQWFHSTALQIRYEDLLSHTEATLARVFEQLGLQPPARAVRKAIKQNSFEAKSGRAIGQEDEKSFYRKGLANDWMNHFDPPTAEAFKSALDGRWNALLLEMGYESRADW
jgi:hypothetical protein